MSAANNKRAFDKDLRVGIKRENEKLALRADARAARELKKNGKEAEKVDREILSSAEKSLFYELLLRRGRD